MPRFAANISLLYNEHAFLDRFAAAASDGFQGVECLFPYAFAAQDLAQRLRDNGLQQVLINAPPGNWEAGERGIACLPQRQVEFRDGFARALDYAAALDKALENRMACSLDRTELYFVSKWGRVGINAEVAKADAQVACAAVSASAPSAAHCRRARPTACRCRRR